MKAAVVLICVAILAAVASFGWSRHQTLRELNRQNAALRQRLEDWTRVKDAQVDMPPAPVDTNELERSQLERDELMKLRSQVGRRHQTERLIHQQAADTLAQADAVQKRGENLWAWREARQDAKAVAGELSMLMEYVLGLAKYNEGKLPGSPAEFRALATRLSPKKQPLLLKQFDQALQSFEFIPATRDLSTNGPPSAVIREIKLRPLPDGSWARYYGLANGQTEERISKSGDFVE